MLEKVRRFKVGEFLSSCFSARRLGLALASDIQDALEDFPDLAVVEFHTWAQKWFTDFMDKDPSSGDTRTNGD